MTVHRIHGFRPISTPFSQAILVREEEVPELMLAISAEFNLLDGVLFAYERHEIRRPNGKVTGQQLLWAVTNSEADRNRIRELVQSHPIGTLIDA